jgi:DNA-binding LacI/PurR family transcriptional regulator
LAALSVAIERHQAIQSRAMANAVARRRRHGERPSAGAKRGKKPLRAPSRFTATSREVAQLAGVSRSAVSRAFTPDASVSDSMRRKVMTAATKLGYQPNVIARSLITDRSRLVGLIMGEWENPFYATRLRGFSEKLQARDYQLMLLTGGSDGSVDGAVQRLMQYRADGIVLVSCLPGRAIAKSCARGGTRLVIVNRESAGLPAINVSTDNAGIGRQVAQLLLQAGARRIGVVRGDPAVSVSVTRTEAFRKAIAESRSASLVLDEARVIGYAAGREFIRDAMRRKPDMDAIFCSSDLTALGVLDGARIDLGLAVPGRLAVVGLGDTPAASWAPYSLTTVRLPVERLIDASIDALLADDAVQRRQLIVAGADLVERSTVRRIPGRR